MIGYFPRYHFIRFFIWHVDSMMDIISSRLRAFFQKWSTKVFLLDPDLDPPGTTKMSTISKMSIDQLKYLYTSTGALGIKIKVILSNPLFFKHFIIILAG